MVSQKYVRIIANSGIRSGGVCESLIHRIIPDLWLYRPRRGSISGNRLYGLFPEAIEYFVRMVRHCLARVEAVPQILWMMRW